MSLALMGAGKALDVAVAPPANAYNTAVDVDSPLAHWKFGDASGNFLDRKGGAALVESGPNTRGVTALVNNNAGDLATSFAGTGVALVANGTAYAQAAFSVEFWVRTTLAATKQTVVGKTNAAGGNGQYGISLLASGAWEWFIRDTTNAFPNVTGGAWAINTTYHVVATYAANALHLYINGAEVGTGAVTVGGPHSDGNATAFVVGAYYDTTPLTGTVDEVAFYSSALTLAKAQAHRTAGL